MAIGDDTVNLPRDFFGSGIGLISRAIFNNLLDVSIVARMTFLIFLVAMFSSWLLRAFLLKMLRIKYPHEFAELGYPSSRKLASLLPRYQDLHIKFWNFLWGGKFLLLKDQRISRLACLALISDVAMGGSVVVLIWSAGK